MIVSCTTNFPLHSHWTPYTYLSDELCTPYTNLGDKLWTSYTNLGDNLWTPYMDLGDNRQENFEEKAENEDENTFFTILTKCTVILRSFYIIYVEISFHLTVPLSIAVSILWMRQSFSGLNLY